MAYQAINWQNGVTPINDTNLNKMDGAIVEHDEQLTASDNLKFRFATDGEGNYGYLGADDSFIPFKSGGGGAVIEQIYQASVKQSTGFSFTPDADVKGFAICDANIVYAFATTDMTIKRLYNNNGIISLTKNANGSFTLKWTSQYTATVTLTVFGIK